MVEKIGEIFDFSNSKELLEEWWWHLDKVASNELEVEIGISPKKKNSINFLEAEAYMH
jgi:hypothetical protein